MLLLHMWKKHKCRNFEVITQHKSAHNFAQEHTRTHMAGVWDAKI